MTDGPVPGPDLDGSVDGHPGFSGKPTHSWPGPVHGISFGDGHAGAKADFCLHGGRFDRLNPVSSFLAKCGVIRREGIRVYLDDPPGMAGSIGQECTFLLARNGGNFGSDDRRWMLLKRTGKLVG